MSAPDYAAEIAALTSALASGELTVEANGERVTYRSVKDIRDALAAFRDLAASAATPANRAAAFGFSAPAFSRG